MTRYQYKYKAAPRWLAGLTMLAVSLALWLATPVAYGALRRDFLTAADTAVVMTDARELAAAEEQMTRYGILSAAAALDGETVSGYVVMVATQGYKSVIRLQTTFEADGQRLAAVRVVSQDETEYLGDRIASPSFTEGFVGRRMPVKLWGSAALGSPVDGLSGSTVSAEAVVKGVNAAHAFLQDYMAG